MHDLLILCYHAVSPSWAAPLSVTPRPSIVSLLRWLNAATAATFADALNGELEGRVVAITFDDNYRSVHG
jgi:peptidoglycan/xylan/chitin deacetylase (PgdA/CDA1 family)